MERQGRILLECLSSQVDFFVVTGDGASPVDPSVQIRRVRLPDRPAFLRITLFAWRSRKIVRACRRDGYLIHSCGFLSCASVDLATVHLCHAAAGWRERGSMPRWRAVNARISRVLGLALEGHFLRSRVTPQVVAVSRQVLNEITENYADVVPVVIGNGVDVNFWIDRSVRSSAGPLRLLMVTSDFALKGVREALEMLVETPDVTLSIAGRGDIGEYRLLAGRLGVKNQVDFLGFCSDLRPVYKNHDVILALGKYESFGLFLVEAALAGMCVVGYRIGVVAEIAGGDDGGRVVERQPGAMAATINELSSNRELVYQLSRVGQERALSWGADKMAQAYLELYGEMMS